MKNPEHEPAPNDIIDFCLHALSKTIEDDWNIVPKDRIYGAIDEILDLRLELMNNQEP